MKKMHAFVITALVVTTFAVTTFVAADVAAAAVVSAGAAPAAPAGPPSVTDTVRNLEAKGYEVILTTVGGGDPSKCSITSIRPGQTTKVGKTFEKRGVFIPTETHKTVYVESRC